MPEQRPDDYNSWVSSFVNWLKKEKETGAERFHNASEAVDEWWQTLQEVTRDDFASMKHYLEQDLASFIWHYKDDMSRSDFVQTMKESVWNELAEITDRSKVEWMELPQDFKHKGHWQAGEWVGMGTLVCKNCHHQLEVTHPIKITDCTECGGNDFLREPLAP